MRLLEAKTLVGFLSFCAKVVCLGWVFIQLLGDFVAKFFPSRPGFCRRILWHDHDNLSWWINLVPKFNGVLFFNNKIQETYQLYTTILLLRLGGFYYKHPSVL